MFVFNENEWDMSHIAVNYHSILLISFILREQGEIELWQDIF